VLTPYVAVPRKVLVKEDYDASAHVILLPAGAAPKFVEEEDKLMPNYEQQSH
jgi:hypothetical protein